MQKIYYHSVFLRYTIFVSLFVLSILPAAEVTAQVSIAYVETEGTGNTQTEAIGDALIEAVYRIYGVRISSDTQSTLFQSRDDNTLKSVTKIHKIVRRQSASDMRNELLGYELVSSRQDAVGLHTVTVQAKYSKYRVPGPTNKRRTLAVLDFPISLGDYLSADSVQVSEFLASTIESFLIQGRRFTVLDRKRNDIYARERKVLQSSDVSIADRARLAKVMGADYLVYGEMSPVKVERQDKSIKISGENKEQIIATILVKFKVMAVATRQLKWSSTVTVEHIVENANMDYFIAIDQVVDAALYKAAELVANELTENIFPPKISKVLAAHRFVLNRGGNTVEKGMLFEVFDVGEYILDPDTGEPLDRLETFVGLAKVVEKKPKYSIAEMEKGGSVSEGMILRKYRGEDIKTQKHKSTAPSYQDSDSDGLPDYLGLLNTDSQD